MNVSILIKLCAANIYSIFAYQLYLSKDVFFKKNMCTEVEKQCIFILEGNIMKSNQPHKIFDNLFRNKHPFTLF